MQQRISMTRQTKNGKIRYYKLELLSTLFGDFIVEREYGNIMYKSPTGIKKSFFDNYNDAYEMFIKLLKRKEKRGYCNASFRRWS